MDLVLWAGVVGLGFLGLAELGYLKGNILRVFLGVGVYVLKHKVHFYGIPAFVA
jgi:hypothetical protein